MTRAMQYIKEKAVLAEIECGLTDCPANKNGKHSDTSTEGDSSRIRLIVGAGKLVWCDFYAKWLESQPEIKELRVTEVSEQE